MKNVGDPIWTRQFVRAAMALAMVVLLSSAGACSDGGDGASDETTPTPPADISGPPPIDAPSTTTESGLTIFIVNESTGTNIESGNAAAVHYNGWLEDGTLFDTSLDGDGDPFIFTLGLGQVIDGWEEGVLGMRPGAVRRLVIPSHLAYGDEGFGDLIPAGATLTFDIELIGFGRPTTPFPTPEP